MIKAVFFDMNETVLNLGLLKEQFDRYFDDEYVLKYWFTKLLHSSCIMGAMNEYENFGELAGAVLENVFFESSKPLTQATKTEILGEFRRLPAYEDVQPSIELLKAANIPAVAVSNSSLIMIKEQLSNAGIFNLFDSYYSVDSVEKYKPFKNIYHAAAEEEGLKPEDIVMVAAHDWDLFGAKKAGLKTAYIERKKTIFNPYYPLPDFKARDMRDLIKQIIA